MPAQFLRTGHGAQAFAIAREQRYTDDPEAGETPPLPDIGRLRHFVRGREIYGDGDQADHIFKVTAGVVRTCKFLRDGRRHVDAFYRKGSMFGLEVGGRYTLSAAAASDCTVISYRRSSLAMLAAQHERSLLQILSLALGSLAQAQAHALSLGCRNAIEKLALFLIACDEGDETGEIVVAVTRADIADYLGLTIETVSRTFAELEHRSLIELHGARQVRLVNRAALRELCL